MKERRSFKRVDEVFGLNITKLSAGGRDITFDAFRGEPKFCDEVGMDFAPGGLKMMCSKALPENTAIEMKMLISDGSGIFLLKQAGVVRWHKHIKGEHKSYFIIGVQFNDPKKREKEKLEKIWRSRL